MRNFLDRFFLSNHYIDLFFISLIHCIYYIFNIFSFFHSFSAHSLFFVSLDNQSVRDGIATLETRRLTIKKSFENRVYNQKWNKNFLCSTSIHSYR